MFIRQISNHTIAHIADNNIELLATVPSLAFGYAQYILNGKFELGEEAIAKNAYYSVLYAEHVLHDRFELAEPEIAKCANFSLRYAIHVLKGGLFLLVNLQLLQIHINHIIMHLTH
jgi:hypothetical protein